jgi:hypothetical protein
METVKFNLVGEISPYTLIKTLRKIEELKKNLISKKNKTRDNVRSPSGCGKHSC